MTTNRLIRTLSAWLGVGCHTTWRTRPVIRGNGSCSGRTSRHYPGVLRKSRRRKPRRVLDKEQQGNTKQRTEILLHHHQAYENQYRRGSEQIIIRTGEPG